ncbi:MAG: SET domain-containing protein [Limisphaerales bacterium]
MDSTSQSLTEPDPGSGDLHLATEPAAAETELVVFKSSPIHGTGGFAKTPISKATRILEYVGERISKGESLRRCEANNAYIFGLNDEQDLDGNVAWNPARFLNHSCAPNCEAEKDDDRIWIVATRDIQAGEEITFNYGYDLAAYRDYPCRCGSPQCVGYIVAEEFFEHVFKGLRPCR